MSRSAIDIDETLCIGSGECVGVAPWAFALGPADTTARVLPGAADGDLDLLRLAVMNCPTAAIGFVESDHTDIGSDPGRVDDS